MLRELGLAQLALKMGEFSPVSIEGVAAFAIAKDHDVSGEFVLSRGLRVRTPHLILWEATDEADNTRGYIFQATARDVVHSKDVLVLKSPSLATAYPTADDRLCHGSLRRVFSCSSFFIFQLAIGATLVTRRDDNNVAQILKAAK